MLRLRRKKQLVRISDIKNPLWKIDEEGQKQKGLIQNSIIKIVAFVLIAGLNWSGLSAVVQTIAYFNDLEGSEVNYTAGTLDFYLSSPTSNFIPPEIDTAMNPGDVVTREISIINATSSNLFKYNIKTIQVNGTSTLCAVLKLEAKMEGVVEYSDGLMNLNLDPLVVLGEDGKDDWLFTVTLPSDASVIAGEECRIKFIFDGSQTRNDLPFRQGFNDTEEIESSFVVAAGTGGPTPLLITKVYYDVDAKHGSECINEWVEIHNISEEPLDLSGWKIKDDTSANLLSAAPLIIPAGGFAIVTGSNTTFLYWSVPADVIKIVLPSGKIGNCLGDNSDRVILESPEGTKIDAMSYGDDVFAFDPSCPDVAEGHLLARIPADVDTDMSADWQDLALPSVKVFNIGGPYTFCGMCNHGSIYQCGPVLYDAHPLPIYWNATNPNGPKTDLLIDIYYVTDNDCDGVVSASDQRYLVAQNLPNPTLSNGYYYWPSVKPYFFGYAWIEVVAKGPENVLNNNYALSNVVFEPKFEETKMVCSESGDCWLEEAAPYYMGEGGGCFGNEETPAESIEEVISNIVEEILIPEIQPVVEEEVIIESQEETATVDATITDAAEEIINSSTAEEIITVTEAPAENISTATEETATEEILTTENQESQGGELIDTINSVVEEAVNESPITEETAVVAEEPAAGEAPVAETPPIIEEAPVIESQPVIAPSNIPEPSNVPPTEDGSTGGSDFN